MFDLILAKVTDSINPGLAILALVFPWIERDAVRIMGPRWLLWVQVLLSLGVVYGVQYADNHLIIWPRAGLDYSTHTAFAVAIITSLVAISRRWLFPLVSLLVAYATLMMYFHYHSLADIFTATLVITPPTWLIHQSGKQLYRGRARSYDYPEPPADHH